MCGRYSLTAKEKAELSKLLGISKTPKYFEDAFEYIPRYNASPYQRMPAFAIRENELIAAKMQWGLVPHWSKDGKVAFSTFNAKSETLEESKLFKPYFSASRCLVPASSFFEWIKIYTKESKTKKIEQKGIKKVGHRDSGI